MTTKKYKINSNKLTRIIKSSQFLKKTRQYLEDRIVKITENRNKNIKYLYLTISINRSIRVAI